MTTLERQLRWYIGLRLVVVTSMALPYYLGQLYGEASSLLDPTPGFFGKIFGATCAATLLYIGMLRWLPQHQPLQAYIQFLGDLLLVSVLIHQFGPGSPFSPFYLVTIIVAATLLGRQAGITVASASAFFYGALQLSFAFGWLGGAEEPEGFSSRLLYTLFVSLLGFYAVALLTARLTHRAIEAEGALEVEREDLADLKVVHQDIVESIPSGLVTTDLAGRITTVNRFGRKILGLGEDDLLGQSIDRLGVFSPEQWLEATAASGREGRSRSELKVTRGGTPLDLGYSLSRLTDGDGSQRGFILIFQDLTRWRKLEEEVRIKDRMAAVGELAAGLAHEIGNPLAAISGSVQMLAQSGRNSVGDTRLLDILLKESQRLDRTIKGFLRFARPRERTSVCFDIAALLTENIALLRNSDEVSSRHSISLHLEPESCSLVGDPDQISQIFWNLTRNALRAMPEGGELTVTGELVSSRYRMAVSDSGRGMSEEERSNLFHPFQSFFDSGTGIGMAIVYRIVEAHGGDLTVDSAPGRGTTITVELPTSLPIPGVSEDPP